MELFGISDQEGRMSYKVLEQNGVEIENADGGVMNRLAVSGRDGIVKGVGKECELKILGNSILINTGLIVVCGVRINVTDLTTLKLSDASPTRDISYQIIAQVKRKGAEISADLFIRETAGLTKDELYSSLAGGVYQIEIGTFTHLSTGEIENLQRSLPLIEYNSVTSASPITEGIVYGDTSVTDKNAVLGCNTFPGNAQNVVIGYEARADLFNVVAVGYKASADDFYAVAIGAEAAAWAEKSIQLGKGKNTVPDTLQIFDKNIFNAKENKLTVDTVVAKNVVADNIGGGASQMPLVYISMASVSETYNGDTVIFNLKVYDTSGILAVGDLLEMCESSDKLRRRKRSDGNYTSWTSSAKMRPFLSKTLQDKDLARINKGEWVSFAVLKKDILSASNIARRLRHNGRGLSTGLAIKYFRIVRRNPEEEFIYSPRKLLSNVLSISYYYQQSNDTITIKLA